MEQTPARKCNDRRSSIQYVCYHKTAYLSFQKRVIWIATLQDEESASKLSNDVEKEKFYRELASAAESGWDFSSRWMRLLWSLFCICLNFNNNNFLPSVTLAVDLSRYHGCQSSYQPMMFVQFVFARIILPFGMRHVVNFLFSGIFGHWGPHEPLVWIVQICRVLVCIFALLFDICAPVS